MKLGAPGQAGSGLGIPKVLMCRERCQIYALEMKIGPRNPPSSAPALQVLLSSLGNGSDEQHTHKSHTFWWVPKQGESHATQRGFTAGFYSGVIQGVWS